MTEWVKILIGAVITAIGVYVSMVTTINDHSRRLNQLDHWVEVHAEKHELQYDKIDGRLSRIEINIARMAGDSLHQTGAAEVLAQPGKR